MRRGVPFLLALLLGACAAPPGDRGRMVYRTVDGRDLSVEVFAPPGARRGAGLAAIVLFHGGAWHRGSPAEMHPQCRYFAARGLVAVAAEYRLSDEGAITPLEAMEDARVAMAWIRRNARRLGVDPTRIAAGGYSAGGQLAVMTAMPADSPPGDGHRPDALLLWSPSLAAHRDPDFLRLLRDRADPAALAPLPKAESGLPPTIVFQGSRDRVARPSDARLFCEQLNARGGRCDLHVYRNRNHVFINAVDDYVDTLLKADAFLVSLGFLSGEGDAEAARSSRATEDSVS